MPDCVVCVAGGLWILIGAACCLLVIIHSSEQLGFVFLFIPLLQLAVLILLNGLMELLCRPGQTLTTDTAKSCWNRT